MESSESPRYIKGQYAWSRTFETDLKNRKDLMPKRRVKVSKRAWLKSFPLCLVSSNGGTVLDLSELKTSFNCRK